MSTMNQIDVAAAKHLRETVASQTAWHKKNFGAFASAHEAYAVILSAFEKTQDVSKMLKKDLERYWLDLKCGEDTAFPKNAQALMESSRYLAEVAILLTGCSEKLTPGVNKRNTGAAQESGPEGQMSVVK